MATNDNPKSMLNIAFTKRGWMQVNTSVSVPAQAKPVYTTSKCESDACMYVCMLDIPKGTMAEEPLQFTSPPHPSKKAAEQAAAQLALERLGTCPALDDPPPEPRSVWEALARSLSDQELMGNQALSHHVAAAVAHPSPARPGHSSSTRDISAPHHQQHGAGAGAWVSVPLPALLTHARSLRAHCRRALPPSPSLPRLIERLREEMLAEPPPGDAVARPDPDDPDCLVVSISANATRQAVKLGREMAHLASQRASYTSILVPACMSQPIKAVQISLQGSPLARLAEALDPAATASSLMEDGKVGQKGQFQACRYRLLAAAEAGPVNARALWLSGAGGKATTPARGDVLLAPPLFCFHTHGGGTARDLEACEFWRWVVSLTPEGAYCHLRGDRAGLVTLLPRAMTDEHSPRVPHAARPCSLLGLCCSQRGLFRHFRLPQPNAGQLDCVTVFVGATKEEVMQGGGRAFRSEPADLSKSQAVTAAKSAAALSALRALHSEDADLFGLRDGQSAQLEPPPTISLSPNNPPAYGQVPTGSEVVVVQYTLRKTSADDGDPRVNEGSHEIRNDDFEMQLGQGQVVPALEACARRLLVGQSATCTASLVNLYGARATWALEVQLLGRHPPPFKPTLASQRHAALARILHTARACSVLDVGCGEGALLTTLLKPEHKVDGAFWVERLGGVDVSARALQACKTTLSNLCRNEPCFPPTTLLSGSLESLTTCYEWGAWDAVTMVEVVEHLDPAPLAAVGAAILGALRPRLLVVSTPNREYNAVLLGLMGVSARLNERGLRDIDHRFEWTRSEFEAWARELADQFAYKVDFHGVGRAPGDDVGEDVGSATQIAVFARELTEEEQASRRSSDTALPVHPELSVTWDSSAEP